jgi:probable HAF family extracellular repeat protein
MTGFLNNHGTAVGAAETPNPTPPHFNPFPCGPGNFVYHALEWKKETTHDLGTLPGGNCSNAIWINTSGEIAGNSETGEIDPLTGFRELRAVVWKHSQILDLGTLGGNQSGAQAINDRGQVVGFALNGIPDPFSIFDAVLAAPDSQCPACGTQTRAFLWQNDHMQDLGTLGGNDAFASGINERGEIVGNSYTDTIPNPTTSIPTLDPFLWEKGRMTDLGTLGGTLGGPTGLNNRGQVIGQSNLAGDQTSDPFLWDQGKLIDLATHGIGGTFQVANAINDVGEIAGAAAFPSRPSDAALWRDGVVTDLGALGIDCFSQAWSISSRGEIGGVSVSCDSSTWHAFLWENGSIVDLNTLIPQNSRLTLVYALAINDHGEIGGLGVPPGVPTTSDTQGHAFLLIPCDADHPNVEDCDYSMVEAADMSNNAAVPQSPLGIPTMDSLARPINPSHNWFKQRYRMLGQQPPLRR